MQLCRHRQHTKPDQPPHQWQDDAFGAVALLPCNHTVVPGFPVLPACELPLLAAQQLPPRHTDGHANVLQVGFNERPWVGHVGCHLFGLQPLNEQPPLEAFGIVGQLVPHRCFVLYLRVLEARCSFKRCAREAAVPQALRAAAVCLEQIDQPVVWPLLPGPARDGVGVHVVCDVDHTGPVDGVCGRVRVAGCVPIVPSEGEVVCDRHAIPWAQHIGFHCHDLGILLRQHPKELDLVFGDRCALWWQLLFDDAVVLSQWPLLWWPGQVLHCFGVTETDVDHTVTPDPALLVGGLTHVPKAVGILHGVEGFFKLSFLCNVGVLIHLRLAAPAFVRPYVNHLGRNAFPCVHLLKVVRGQGLRVLARLVYVANGLRLCCQRPGHGHPGQCMNFVERELPFLLLACHLCAPVLCAGPSGGTLPRRGSVGNRDYRNKLTGLQPTTHRQSPL